MCPHTVIGFFCDDTRKEQSEQETIIGVFPDTLNVSSVPGFLPKLCLYVRFHLDLKSKPKSITIRLNRPDDRDSLDTEVKKDVISKAFKDAKKSDHPYAGVIARAAISPFPIDQPGRFDIVVSIDGKDETCGSLAIVLAKP